MKSFLVLFLTTIAIGFTACKKDYTCTAKDSSGNETILKCENCSKKDADDYEKSIINTGYTSASCEK